MSDPTGYPVATTAAVPVVEPRVLTPAEQESVDMLYEELKPQATDSARQYVLARTPAAFQEAMVAKIDADWPVPPAADPEIMRQRRVDADSYLRTSDPVPSS